MADNPKRTNSQVDGIVIPVDWSSNGAVKAVALADFEEAVYHLVPGPLADRLAKLLQRRVTVTGYVFEQGSRKMIEVRGFTKSKSPKTRLALLALAGALGLGLAGGEAPAADKAPRAGQPAAARPAAKPRAVQTKGFEPQPAEKKASRNRNQVARLQAALAKSGFRTKADGHLGPKTRAALKRFQQKHNLKVTGKPDAATKKALGLN
jgi:hypothetical protein